MKFKLNQKNIEKQILKLQKELDKNNGVVPDKWIPWLDLIKMLLRFAEMFTNDKIDAIIEKIIQSIEVWETKKLAGK